MQSLRLSRIKQWIQDWNYRRTYRPSLLSLANEEDGPYQPLACPSCRRIFSAYKQERHHVIFHDIQEGCWQISFCCPSCNGVFVEWIGEST